MLLIMNRKKKRKKNPEFKKQRPSQANRFNEPLPRVNENNEKKNEIRECENRY